MPRAGLWSSLVCYCSHVLGGLAPSTQCLGPQHTHAASQVDSPLPRSMPCPLQLEASPGPPPLSFVKPDLSALNLAPTAGALPLKKWQAKSKASLRARASLRLGMWTWTQNDSQWEPQTTATIMLLLRVGAYRTRRDRQLSPVVLHCWSRCAGDSCCLPADCLCRAPCSVPPSTVATGRGRGTSGRCSTPRSWRHCHLVETQQLRRSTSAPPSRVRPLHPCVLHAQGSAAHLPRPSPMAAAMDVAPAPAPWSQLMVLPPCHRPCCCRLLPQRGAGPGCG